MNHGRGDAKALLRASMCAKMLRFGIRAHARCFSLFAESTEAEAVQHATGDSAAMLLGARAAAAMRATKSLPERRGCLPSGFIAQLGKIFSGMLHAFKEAGELPSHLLARFRRGFNALGISLLLGGRRAALILHVSVGLPIEFFLIMRQLFLEFSIDGGITLFFIAQRVNQRLGLDALRFFDRMLMPLCDFLVSPLLFPRLLFNGFLLFFGLLLPFFIDSK